MAVKVDVPRFMFNAHLVKNYWKLKHIVFARKQNVNFFHNCIFGSYSFAATEIFDFIFKRRKFLLRYWTRFYFIAFYLTLSILRFYKVQTFYANPCEIEKQFYSFKNVKFINTCKRIEQKNVYGDKNNNNNKSCSIMSHYFIYNRRPVWIGAMYVLLYEFDTADNKYFFTNIILCRTLLLQSDVSCYLLPVEHTSTMCRFTFVRTNFHCYSFDDFV